DRAGSFEKLAHFVAGLVMHSLGALLEKERDILGGDYLTAFERSMSYDYQKIPCGNRSDEGSGAHQCKSAA
ncbi:MAG: hypothetical protein RR997_06365, partial [Raoultibacter sp.]